MSDLPLFHTRTNELESKVAILTKRLEDEKKKVKAAQNKLSNTKYRYNLQKNKVASRLLKRGMDVELVAGITGVSLNDVKILQEKRIVFRGGL